MRPSVDKARCVARLCEARALKEHQRNSLNSPYFVPILDVKRKGDHLELWIVESVEIEARVLH
jgi:hypothetical protein